MKQNQWTQTGLEESLAEGHQEGNLGTEEGINKKINEIFIFLFITEKLIKENLLFF